MEGGFQLRVWELSDSGILSSDPVPVCPLCRLSHGKEGIVLAPSVTASPAFHCGPATHRA